MDVSHGLGEFEQLVLLALMRLGSEAYGVAIRDEIERQPTQDIHRNDGLMLAICHHKTNPPAAASRQALNACAPRARSDGEASSSS